MLLGQVIQKLYEHGTQIQKTVLANIMKGRVLAFSCHRYGCRVVQKVTSVSSMSPLLRLTGVKTGD